MSNSLLSCPFCGCSQLSTKYSMDGDSFVYCQGCAAQGPKMPSSYISKWNQRQPHPDSVRLKWLVVNSATVYGFNSPCDGYAVVTTENEVETCTHDYGEAIDKAMEQEQ